MRALVLLACLQSAACIHKVTRPPDGGQGDLGVADEGVPDLQRPPDAQCTFERFSGFLGTVPSERRLDCRCGCSVDTFDEAAVQPFWTAVTQNARVRPQTNIGVGFELEPSDGGMSSAALQSTGPGASFFLDGDFDLLVDYFAGAAPPPGAALLLEVGAYAIVRDRSDAGGRYAARGPGGALSISTSALAGTLELTRAGGTVSAFADGQKLGDVGAGDSTRLQLALRAQGRCDVADDGGAGCQFVTVWHNLRLTKGALVDRQ